MFIDQTKEIAANVKKAITSQFDLQARTKPFNERSQINSRTIRESGISQKINSWLVLKKSQGPVGVNHSDGQLAPLIGQNTTVRN